MTDCWVVAGYAGVLPAHALAPWYSFATGRLHAEGVYLNVAKVGQSRKLYRLPREESSLLQRLPGEASLSLYAHPGAYSQLVFGWDGCAVVNCVPGCAVIAGLETAVSWSREKVGLVLEQMWERFPLEYGTAFQRDSGKGPELYALGLPTGLGRAPEDREEAVAITRWGTEGLGGEGYRNGLLRDVYPFNALNPHQLDSKLGRVRLQEWISASSSRGSLRGMARGGALWEVPDRHIAAVRKALRQEMLLL